MPDRGTNEDGPESRRRRDLSGPCGPPPMSEGQRQLGEIAVASVGVSE